MSLSLQLDFRKLEATDALKKHITRKVKKFEKFITYPMEVHVMMSLEKMLHCAEITCHAEHQILFAVAKTKDLYESIDMAVHKIEGQLKKKREKKKGHKAGHLSARPKALKLASDLGAAIPHLEKKAVKAGRLQ